MTMGPLGGMLGSAAGAPLSQTAGSETERAQKESLVATPAGRRRQKGRASGRNRPDRTGPGKLRARRRRPPPVGSTGKRRKGRKNEQPATSRQLAKARMPPANRARNSI